MKDLLREEHLCEIILNFGFVFIFLFLAPVAIFFSRAELFGQYWTVEGLLRIIHVKLF